MPAWAPAWRISVGDDVYTNVTSVSFTSGRTDIDRQANAGYSRIEIVNTADTAYTIDIGETVTLEVKNSAGTYVPVFGGEVTDFNIGVRSPDESGYLTVGTVLAAGSLAKLPKYVFTDALAEGLDGAQIATILGAALNLTWNQVTPTVTWATYPPTIIWANAESYVGTVDSGTYTMISVAAGTPKSDVLVNQIASSALGQVYEDKYGRVNYDDSDHREVYLNAYGYTQIDGTFATPTTIRSTTQVAKIRNSLIYKYGASYGSTYSTTDSTSIATYGLYQKSTESNIKSLVNITAVGTRDLSLRANPYAQFESITFRLDNPNMTSVTRDALITSFFGQPIEITNLPSNMFSGTFRGFLEGYSFSSTPSYVDITLNLSPAKFSLPIAYGNYTLAQTYTTDTTFTVPSGVSQIAVFIKAKGGNGQNGSNGSSGAGGAGGTGGGGGGAGAFWNFDVVPAQTYAVGFNSGSTERVSFGSLLTMSAGGDGSAGGSGGGVYSIDAGLIYYNTQTGTPGGAGGASKATNGQGNAGSNSFGNGTLLTVPTNIGLPATIRAGGGGGGGGSGAKDTTGTNFYNGGSGGTGGAIDGNNGGGQGGFAAQDFNLNGFAGGSGVLGNGGGGGGGGAYQAGYGNGTGGTGSTGTGAVVYIYTR
jgi:hypothetical protein